MVFWVPTFSWLVFLKIKKVFLLNVKSHFWLQYYDLPLSLLLDNCSLRIHLDHLMLHFLDVFFCRNEKCYILYSWGDFNDTSSVYFTGKKHQSMINSKPSFYYFFICLSFISFLFTKHEWNWKSKLIIHVTMASNKR